MSLYERMLDEFDRLDDEHHGWTDDADEPCPDCDGDGYIDLLDDNGFVIGPGPCPRGCHPDCAPKRAPLKRNEHMAALGADLCIAFWDRASTGTANMMTEARKHGIPVEVVDA